MYTPTDEEVREAIAEWAWSRRMFRPELGQSDGGEGARWLAVHGAALRAEWEAEQGETEWEYGWKSHFPNGEEYEWQALPTREAAEEAIRIHQDFEDNTDQIGGRLTFTLWKRTKAKPGPWLPVEQGDES